MSERIRLLEDGLAILQSSVSRDPHPLLSADLLKVKSVLELHSAADLPDGVFDTPGSGPSSMREGGSAGPEASDDGEEDGAGGTPPLVDALGTLALRDDGAATFYGRSAGSEVRAPNTLR